MRKFITKAKNNFNSFIIKANTAKEKAMLALANNSGEGYLDTVIFS